MLRLLSFLLILIIPAIFSWWLFIPLALLYVYLAKSPYEMLIAGFFLDMVYYFGDNFLYRHMLALISLVLLIVAFFLSKLIRWNKVI